MKLKTIFLIIFILVIFGLSIIGYFKAIPPPQREDFPRIEIWPKFYDFGEINFGDVVNYNFKVKNSGKEVLEIKRIATSCPCATAKIAKEKINPGEEVELLVSYDSGAMGTSHGKGKQERIIYVKSNDPINPQIEVMIYASVK